MIGASELARLLRRAGSGDRRAFTRVYDATAARAYGLCRRLLDDPVVAEDTAEEAYREVWLRAATYDPARGSAAAWVLAIVHRVAVARAHETGVVRASTVTVADAGTGPAAALTEQVLDQLGTMEWAAVELAYFGGRRHGDVAALLGLTVDAAQARIRDGLVRVRALTVPG